MRRELVDFWSGGGLGAFPELLGGFLGTEGE